MKDLKCATFQLSKCINGKLAHIGAAMLELCNSGIWYANVIMECLKVCKAGNLSSGLGIISIYSSSSADKGIYPLGTSFELMLKDLKVS